MEKKELLRRLNNISDYFDAIHDSSLSMVTKELKKGVNDLNDLIAEIEDEEETKEKR